MTKKEGNAALKVRSTRWRRDGRPLLLPEAEGGLENFLRDLQFARLRQRDDLGRRNDCHLVAVGIEADARTRDVVHHYRVNPFLAQLAARVFQQVLGFGGESDQHWRTLAGGVA